MPKDAVEAVKWYRKKAEQREAAAQFNLGLMYANGTGVFVKRSSGEESLAFVKEFNEEKLVYTLELDKAGSGKIKQCREKDIVRTLDAEGGAAEAPAVAPRAGSAGEPSVHTGHGKDFHNRGCIYLWRGATRAWRRHRREIRQHARVQHGAQTCRENA